MTKRAFSVVILVAFFALSACSASKDSIKNRAYHNMTSWFNALFNGQAAMDQKLDELKSGHKDDYFQTLPVEPYGEFVADDSPEIMQAPVGVGRGPNLKTGNLLNNENSSKTGFAKAEEKALKVIANHSMNIKGKERNKLISRAYLMLGQARYYQGKPFQAMDALQQVQGLPFDKHKEESKYYAALAQVQAGNDFAAMEVLDELYQNKDIKKDLKSRVAKHLAWKFYEEGENESALNGLDTAIKYSKNRNEKARLNFIQGQILTEMGKYDEANAKFNKSFKLKPGFEMEARSQVAVAMNFDPMLHDYNSYKKRLMKLVNTGTYATYKNEFFYALGQLEEKRDSLGLAQEAYTMALNEKMSDPRFRAETYAAIGQIKFNASDYVYAGAYYDSAVTSITEGPRKVELTKFRDNLRSVIDKYYLVQRNDSILKLVAMPEADRNTFFNNYIEDLKKRDEQKQREEEEQATQFLTQTKGGNFGSGFDQGDGRFYFYSSSAKSQGESEFRRIWGDRSLKDNWRLSSTGSTIEDQKAELTGTANLNNPRRYELAYYLEQIPSSQRAIHDLKMERDTTELSLGMDYFDKFKNAKLATNTLEHLVNTPPKEDEVLLKALYNLYRVNADNNLALSEKYKNKVLEEYPNTIYAEFILNPQSDFSEENSPEVIALYLETYDAYKEEEFELVKENAMQAFEEFPMAKIIAKFALLNAYADAALSGEEQYKAGLERVIILYPGTDEAKHAQSLLDKLDGKNKVQPPASKQEESKKLAEDANEKRLQQEQESQKLIEKQKRDILEGKSAELDPSPRKIQMKSDDKVNPKTKSQIRRER